MHGIRKEIVTYRDDKFLVYAHTCDCKATIGTVKSTLRIPPRHNGVVPIKISGPIIETIWHTSSQMTVPQKEKMQTST